jgi:hypothetical protein
LHVVQQGGFARSNVALNGNLPTREPSLTSGARERARQENGQTSTKHLQSSQTARIERTSPCTQHQTNQIDRNKAHRQVPTAEQSHPLCSAKNKQLWKLLAVLSPPNRVARLRALWRENQNLTNRVFITGQIRIRGKF